MTIRSPMRRLTLFCWIFLLVCFLAWGCSSNDDDDRDSPADDDDDDSVDDDDDDDDNNDNDDNDNDDDSDDPLGRATLAPDTVQIGSFQRFKVDYTANTPIQVGGGVKIYFASAWDHISECGMTTDSDRACGYTTAVTDVQDVQLALSINLLKPHAGVRLYEASVTVEAGTLQTGQTISLTYGAGEGKAMAQLIAHTTEVTVLVSTDGLPKKNPVYSELQNSPVLTLTPLTPERLTSAIQWNEGRLALSLVDIYGNLAEDYAGEASVTLVPESGEESFLGLAPIQGGTGGLPLPTISPGYYVIRAFLNIQGGLISQVPFAPGKQAVWFGDPHFHTRISDSHISYDPLDSYQYAKDVALLDFAASSDHAECTAMDQVFTQFLVREDVDNSWDEVKRINELYNSSELVTLLGYEVTMVSLIGDRQGHINVYYRGNDGNLITYGDQTPGIESVQTVPDLWSILDRDGVEAITIPHHTLRGDWIGSDFLHYNENYMRLVEIYSHHGCSESELCINSLYNPFLDPDAIGSVQRAVGPLGYRLGFIAGSDNHSGHPSGTGAQDPFYDDKPGGLTAIVTEELSRESLWTALQNRSVYATSGARVYLEFSINGTGMGQQVTDPVEIIMSGRAIGTDIVRKVEVFKYDASGGWRKIFSQHPYSLFWDSTFEDDAFSQSSVYYLRVTQMDDTQAWSSPIWVDITADKKSSACFEPILTEPVAGPTAQGSVESALAKEGLFDVRLRSLGYVQ